MVFESRMPCAADRSGFLAKPAGPPPCSLRAQQSTGQACGIRMTITAERLQSLSEIDRHPGCADYRAQAAAPLLESLWCRRLKQFYVHLAFTPGFDALAVPMIPGHQRLRAASIGTSTQYGAMLRGRIPNEPVTGSTSGAKPVALTGKNVRC